MQHKKKLLTTLTLTILALSIILATIPMASAISLPTLDKYTGPVGTKVLVSGSEATKWGLVEIYWNTPAAENKLNQTYANSAGIFSCYITVPKDYAGKHFVIAKDVETGAAEGVEFTITSKIVLKPDKGLPGDLVTVTGTGFAKNVKVGIGFGDAVAVSAETVTLTGTQPGPLTGTLANRPVQPTLTLTCAVTVTVGEDFAEGVVSVTDPAGDGILEGTLDISVDIAGVPTPYTVSISGTINYATGAISLTATVTGTPTATVTIDSATAAYTSYTYDVTPLAGITTNATGSFEASIKIPAILEDYYGDYDVTAVDAKGNKATDTITVNYYVTVKPEKGPPGITVDVSGRIEPAKPVEVKFGRATTFVTAFTTTSDADGLFSGEYTLPTLLEPGTTYEFRAIWDTKERTTPFEVLPAPTITLTPTSAAVGAKVTISGEDFSAKANVTVYFDTTVVNTTATDSAGAFTCTFIVPTVATGTYKVKAVDQYGASAEAYFTVVPPPAIVVQLRTTEYLQGDTISFYIYSTLPFASDIAIVIVDPDDYPFWTATWAAVDIDTGVYGVPYEDQLDAKGFHLTLPSDAPLGSWNWTATYTMGTVEKKATGLFTVAERILSAVLDKLDALNAKIVSLDGKVATINTNVGNVKTSVDNIGLTVTSIEGDVATIETALGTLQGTVTSIDGNVATIETDIGTVQADISDIQGEFPIEVEIPAALTLAVYVAVIFAVIAAIATIYSIFELRRKIAS